MDGEVKLRSVCEACTSAKIRCNGKVPCERCLRKGIECHYRPFKNRGGNNPDASAGSAAISVKSSAVLNSQNKQQTPVSGGGDPTDTILDEDERKTWSVFFTLYRSFGKGCSKTWFRRQVFKMLMFLGERADHDADSANALARLKSWMTALGIDVQQPPNDPMSLCVPNLRYTNIKTPSFQTSVDALRADAAARNLPMLTIGKDFTIEVNQPFSKTFKPTAQDLTSVLRKSAGGFLPWGGDIMARILSKENDLLLYLQGVANNLDAIGLPKVMPGIQAIPSMNVLHSKVRSGQDVLCIVRAVQIAYYMEDSFGVTTTVVFEIPQEEDTNGHDAGFGHIPEKARHFSETNLEDQRGATELKRLFEEFDENDAGLPELPVDFLGEGDDDGTWLDNLLTWAADEPNTANAISLPVTDDMFDLKIDS